MKNWIAAIMVLGISLGALARPGNSGRIERQLLNLQRECEPYDTWKATALCYREGIDAIVGRSYSGPSDGGYDSGGGYRGDSGSGRYRQPSYRCSTRNVFGRYASGGGCNTFGCYFPGGGCNTFGCYDRGGGCNTFGCYEAGGSCNTYGCVREASKESRACYE